MWSPRQMSPSPITPLFWSSTNNHTFLGKRPPFSKRKSIYSSHRKLQNRFGSPLNVSANCDVLLTHSIFQRRWLSISWFYYFMLRLHSASQLTLALLLALKKEAAIWWTAYGNGHLAGNYRRPLGTLGGLQPRASEKSRSSAHNPQRNEFCQQCDQAWKYILLQSSLQVRTQFGSYPDCTL